MEGDEHATFPPLPGDRHPSAGHPLPDLRPHPRLPAGQYQRGPDRALPPGSSRGARHPIPVTGSRLRPAGDSAVDVCEFAAQLAADLGPSARQRSHGVVGALEADAQRAGVRYADSGDGGVGYDRSYEGLCASVWSTAPGRCPDLGRCWQLTTPRLIEVNGSLGVLPGRSADSFEYQMLHGIRLAFRRFFLRAGESPARGDMALPQALRAAISGIADTRASGRARAECRRSGRAEDAQNGAAKRHGSCLTPLDWGAPGSVDGSRRDSGPIYDGTPGPGAWDVKGRW